MAIDIICIIGILEHIMSLLSAIDIVCIVGIVEHMLSLLLFGSEYRMYCRDA